MVVKSQILAGGRGLGKFTNGLQVRGRLPGRELGHANVVAGLDRSLSAMRPAASAGSGFAILLRTRTGQRLLHAI